MIELPAELDWCFPFCPAPPEWIVDWSGLTDSFEWIRAMANCPQDPTWHAEGDVGVHTRLVCEQLAGFEAWRELPELHRSIVFAATLMHDVAKPAVTCERDGRIRAPKHAMKGAQLVRRLLYQSLLPTKSAGHLAVREQIVGLVRKHGVPLNLLDTADPNRIVITASQSVRCDWLAMVAEADVLGRECPDKPELLQRLSLFRDVCEENHCLSHPWRFVSDHTRRVYLSSRNANPGREVFDDTCCEVVVMSGIPGCGKDTWIAKNLAQYPVVSLDNLRTEMGIDPSKNQGQVGQHARELARAFLRREESFVWNATNLTQTVRQPLLSLFHDYRARTRIVYVESAWETILRRNIDREEQVPTSVLQRLAGRFEVPTVEEAHDVQYTVN
jgi:predicted kinase